MATVYLAWDESLRVERAIKLFSTAATAGTEMRARIETEARAMASLHHPNVVAVHDIREDEERIFLVMELVPGGTLWEWVAAYGPLPERLAVQVMLPVLDAVRAAHAAGVVHRDLKPQNILLDAVGAPRVTDFGIARIQEAFEKPFHTHTGSTLGTWPFMAPEQRRDPRTAGPASDIYSLGATLFSMIRAQQPFDLFAAGEDAELLAGIRPDLAAVIRRATRFKVEDRFQRIEDLTTALAEILPTLPEVPESTPPLGVRPALRPSATLPTVELALDEPSIITNVDSAGPAAEILYRRRRLMEAIEEQSATPPPARSGAWLWAAAAAAPALMALVAGGVVMALDVPSQTLWARRNIALLGEASVELRGEDVEVTLEDVDGLLHQPGPLAPGSYRVLARFADGEALAEAGLLDLEAGDILDLVCSASERRCTTEPTR